MRHIATTAPAVLLGLLGPLLHAAGSDAEYRWRIVPQIGGDSVNLTLSRRAGHSTMSTTTTVPRSSLRGLEDASFLGGPVSFQLKREAGTMNGKGSFLLGIGSGPLTFQPDPRFLSDLKAIGFRDVGEERLFDLALRDFRLATARELRLACDCVETLDDVIQLSDHGVDARYVRKVTQFTWQSWRVDEIARMKDHGVSASLLEALWAGGYQLPAKSVIELQDHGVDASFVREMAPYFKASSDMHGLVTLRDHGVSADFVRRVREAGDAVPVNELIQLHDHGVDPDLLRSSKEAGLEGSTQSVIALHDHGVDPHYVRSMAKALGGKVAANELIQLHDHGVSTDFAQRIADGGFAVHDAEQLIRLHEHGVPTELLAQAARSHRVSFTPDEIIRLHDQGIDAGFVRSFDEVGFANAPADDLIELHNHGVTADFVRRMQAEGFNAVRVSQLVKMKDHGL